jgi:hypothetical protein
MLPLLITSPQCRRARKALVSRLYSTVELKTNKHCKTALEALSVQPRITSHIRSFVTWPNNVEHASDSLNEAYISDLVLLMASHLPSLESLNWGGLEMPDDKVWLSFMFTNINYMRANAYGHSCPHLRNINTTIGSEPLRSSDHVSKILFLIIIMTSLALDLFDLAL